MRRTVRLAIAATATIGVVIVAAPIANANWSLVTFDQKTSADTANSSTPSAVATPASRAPRQEAIPPAQDPASPTDTRPGTPSASSLPDATIPGTQLDAKPVADMVTATLADTLREQLDTVAYWTPDRMRKAEAPQRRMPLKDRNRKDGLLPGLPNLGLPNTQPGLPDTEDTGDTPEAQPKANQDGGGYPWQNGGPVTRTTGKVFFTLHGTDYVCSASSVRSTNADTVVTAGHCVNEGPGEFASRWIFVPGYHDGQRPYGSWTARHLFAPSAWVDEGDINRDVGFAAVNVTNGRHLANVVGAQAIGFNVARGQQAYSFGYPAVGSYDGESLYYCRGTASQDDNGTTDQGIPCDMTEGSSGGPWLSSFDPATGTGTITSVNSFGYDDMPDVMWGPYFDNTIKSIFDAAQRS